MVQSWRSHLARGELKKLVRHGTQNTGLLAVIRGFCKSCGYAILHQSELQLLQPASLGSNPSAPLRNGTLHNQHQKHEHDRGNRQYPEYIEIGQRGCLMLA